MFVASIGVVSVLLMVEVLSVSLKKESCRLGTPISLTVGMGIQDRQTDRPALQDNKKGLDEEGLLCVCVLG